MLLFRNFRTPTNFGIGRDAKFITSQIVRMTKGRRDNREGGHGSKPRKVNESYGYDTEEELFGRSVGSYSGSSAFPGLGIESHSYKDPMIKPRNARQKEYVDFLEKPNPSIVIATGAAGTGKTMIACTIAVKKLLENEIHKIIITRPMVNVGDDIGIGFLPGSLEEKCQPWLAPLTDVFYKYMSPQKFQGLLAKQVIEICPLEMMRGRSFEDCFIIVDEAQNCTTTQMLMLLTRIGNGSKIVITGDPMQQDRRGMNGTNGLRDFLDRIAKHPEHSKDIGVVHFTEECIERHPIIKQILKLYDVSYAQTA